MDIPIVLKGVIHGTTITLDEKSFLPDDYRVTLHLILERGEGVRLAAAGLVALTPEEIAKLEQTMIEWDGWPFKWPAPATGQEGLAAHIPVVLKGVSHGTTITLDEKSFMPDGYRVTLHLILEPGEGLRLAAGGWADMTPEEIADFEQAMTEFDGEPFKMPEPDPL
jgi:hypothetical protein